MSIRAQDFCLFLDKVSGKHVETNYKKVFYPKSTALEDSPPSEDQIDLKFFKKAFNEKQRLEQKKSVEVVNQRISDSLRDLCLPKLLCEIAAKPTYLLTDKEKHVLSLLK
jgi:hypothetical protein